MFVTSAREILHLVDPVLTPFFSFRQDGSDASNVKNAEDIPSGWTWERFEIINARAPSGYPLVMTNVAIGNGHL